MSVGACSDQQHSAAQKRQRRSSTAVFSETLPHSAMLSRKMSERGMSGPATFLLCQLGPVATSNTLQHKSGRGAQAPPCSRKRCRTVHCYQRTCLRGGCLVRQRFCYVSWGL